MWRGNDNLCISTENVSLSLLHVPFVVDKASGFYNGMLGALRLSLWCPVLKYDFQQWDYCKELSSIALTS